jgi:hypothetical protein
MEATTQRRRRTRAEWQSLVTRAAASPLGTAAFCAAEGISTTCFYLWRKRLRADAPERMEAPASGTFFDLGVLAPGAEHGAPWDLELDLGAGVMLRLRRG